MKLCKRVSMLVLVASSMVAFPNAAEAKKDKVVEPPYEAVTWPNYDGAKIGIGILSFEDGLSPQAGPNWLNADSGIQVTVKIKG